jgi:hypothetical protein
MTRNSTSSSAPCSNSCELQPTYLPRERQVHGSVQWNISPALAALVGWFDQRQQNAVAYLVEENRVLVPAAPALWSDRVKHQPSLPATAAASGLSRISG